MKNLKQYAEHHKITYQAAWNRYKAGKIPEAVCDEGGKILIPDHVVFSFLLESKASDTLEKLQQIYTLTESLIEDLTK